MTPTISLALMGATVALIFFAVSSWHDPDDWLF